MLFNIIPPKVMHLVFLSFQRTVELALRGHLYLLATFSVFYLRKIIYVTYLVKLPLNTDL